MNTQLVTLWKLFEFDVKWNEERQSNYCYLITSEDAFHFFFLLSYFTSLIFPMVVYDIIDWLKTYIYNKKDNGHKRPFRS